MVSLTRSTTTMPGTPTIINQGPLQGKATTLCPIPNPRVKGVQAREKSPSSSTLSISILMFKCHNQCSFLTIHHQCSILCNLSFHHHPHQPIPLGLKLCPVITSNPANKKDKGKARVQVQVTNKQKFSEFCKTTLILGVKGAQV